MSGLTSGMATSEKTAQSRAEPCPFEVGLRLVSSVMASIFGKALGVAEKSSVPVFALNARDALQIGSESNCRQTELRKLASTAPTKALEFALPNGVVAWRNS